MPAAVYIPKTDQARRRGQEVPRVRRLARRAATPQTDGRRADRAVPGQGLHAARRRAAGGQGPAGLLRRRATPRPALEFLSPVKGPSLEQITVEVGSGHDARRPRAPRSVRPGRQEAGQAARPAGLVTEPQPSARLAPAGSGGRRRGGRPRWPGADARADAAAARSVARPTRTGSTCPAAIVYVRASSWSRRSIVVLLRLTRWTLFDCDFIGLDNFSAVLPRAGPASRACATR